MAEESRSEAQAKGRSGARAVVALVLASIGGFGVALALTIVGVGRYVGAMSDRPDSAPALEGLVSKLESVVVIFGVASLALLVGVIALIVLLRSLAEDVESARRGPVAR